ncbi:porin family protein [Chryseobacterium profundimaris]|uniref:Outer membrane protein beta-barrel domain-containing protein n=1 Tax=Chryseobacterium profundimaris TaxID=1387275 RepID=A0ABY1NIR0_9FLAO|nr:porin family protein [Chryseobacterium profundimaris]SMP09927.1 Outer membrane protein beta-barrel domain-containing protein [Chryseobacterium profundimaris]
MKKFLLLTAVAVIGMSAKAQETRFGAKAGYSLSTLKQKDNSGSESSDPLHTFYVGGLVEHKISDKFGIQGEVLYSPLGGKVDESGAFEGDFSGDVRVKAKTTFGTLLIPVSAKYFITENLSVSGGASFGIILSAKAKYEITGNASIGDLGTEFGLGDNVDIKDQVNTLNIAPFIGAEYMLENGLFFDARYNLGVSNLAKDTSDGEKLTNSFFQVGIGFKFGGN